jgi:signal transduction histidine kinase
MSSPILLIAPDTASIVITDALCRELNLPSVRTSNRRAGLAALRRGEYALVLLDEGLADTNAVATDILFQNAGVTPVLEINFALAGVARIVRQVRAALHRRTQEQARARAAATESLQSELRASLSGLLLESQLALRDAAPEQEPKLRHLVRLAGDLRDRLRA